MTPTPTPTFAVGNVVQHGVTLGIVVAVDQHLVTTVWHCTGEHVITRRQHVAHVGTVDRTGGEDRYALTVIRNAIIAGALEAFVERYGPAEVTA